MKLCVLKILFLCAVFLGNSSEAIAVGKHALDLRLGWSYAQSRDVLGSPLLYEGAAGAFGLGYRYRGFAEHQVQINGAFGSLKPGVTSFEKSADYIYGDLQYGYFRRWSRFEHVKWGLIWNTVFALRSYNYRPDQGEAVYDFFSSINVALAYERVYGAGRIYAQVYVPLLVYVARSPYALKDERLLASVIRGGSIFWTALKGGHVTSLHRFFYGQIDLGYERPLLQRLILNMRYQTVYYRYTRPMKTATFVQRLSAGVAFAF